jgi:amidophosphoribosyltransferase
MSEDLKHSCGIAAVYLPKPLSSYSLGGCVPFLYKMLLRQQNRGQLSAGVTTYNCDRQQLIDTYKKAGLVSEVFWTRMKPKFEGILRSYKGDRGIGHVRYATFGADDEGLAQPFERHHGRKWKWFSFAFNGNIANYHELKQEVEKKQYHLVRNADTELLLLLLADEHKGERKKPLDTVFENISGRIDGAFSLAYLNAEGALAVVRGPLGIRPVSYVIDDNMVAAASESHALMNETRNGIKSLKPGEMILVQDGTVEVKKYTESKRCAHCMFEWVYFANPSSAIDGVSVYESRWRLGQQLAKAEPLEVNSDEFVVVGVPDTAKPAADSYAHELGVPSMEGLVRNRYVGRTFIEGRDRSKRAREKYTVLKPVVKGKKVLLIEDSIVRGTTGRALINYIREYGGAKEIHVRVSCPPIRFPCFYGIDMSTLDELVAARLSQKDERERKGKEDLNEKVVEEIRKEINADSLSYLKIESLVKALRMPREKLCMACLTGEYPTPKGRELVAKAEKDFGKGSSKRTYE